MTGKEVDERPEGKENEGKGTENERKAVLRFRICLDLFHLVSRIRIRFMKRIRVAKKKVKKSNVANKNTKFFAFHIFGLNVHPWIHSASKIWARLNSYG